MKTHTPTPWRVFDWDKVDHITKAQKGFQDFHSIGIESKEHGSIAQLVDRNEANANHIVHCVNSHDKLVSALENLLPHVNQSYPRASVAAKEAIELLKTFKP